MVLDAPNMEFLFGLDMLRKHQCFIDLKENVLRVGGGEVSVPFLAEKEIPSRFLDEERYAKEASSSGAQAPMQPDAKQCGFFVMRYMKEFIHELAMTGSCSLKSQFGNRKYSQEEIDEVRVEWASCVLEHI